MDITNIPKPISSKKNECLLTIKDHFSKYCWCFLLPDKKASSVATALEKLFDTGNIPKLMHSDNGNEFKGEVSKLLESYSIKQVKGRPYNPKCQGLVENCNKYIKKYLILSYLTGNPDDYDIKNAIDKICFGYNNREHSVTKQKPIHVYNSKIRALYQEVYANIQKFYKNRQAKPEYFFEKDQKIAIANDVIVAQQFIRDSNKPYSKSNIFHTIGKISEKTGQNSVKIEIILTLNPNLKVNTEYWCNASILYRMTEEQFQDTQRYLEAQMDFISRSQNK